MSLPRFFFAGYLRFSLTLEHFQNAGIVRWFLRVVFFDTSAEVMMSQGFEPLDWIHMALKALGLWSTSPWQMDDFSPIPSENSSRFPSQTHPILSSKYIYPRCTASGISLLALLNSSVITCYNQLLGILIFAMSRIYWVQAIFRHGHLYLHHIP